MNDRQQPQTQRQMQANPAPPGGQAVLHPTLVPELLGFSPQMLLDDIINTAAEAILQCITAMEHFMQRWADTRATNPPPPPKEKEKEKKGKGKKKQEKAREQAQEDGEWDTREAVERALVAFSTLLESHTDVAFDFFEAWSMRNIFAIPPDLPVVAPHQRGLDLNPRPEEEAELMTDIEELRRKIENQRRLRRTYMKAVRIAHIGRLRSERRLARLSYLSSPLVPSPSSSPPTTPDASNPTGPTFLSALSTLPPSVHELFEQAAALPHIEGLSANALPALPDMTKRLWETGHTGYINWAVQQLITRSKEIAPAPSGGSTAVSNAMDMAEQVGDAGDIRNAVEVVKMEERLRANKQGDAHDQGMDVDT